ncbi:MAG: hypothetical protein A2086_01685 [Spirochaetes bacterium GWD1_27_9]|nr:MAG: hypothetical protein A2Z98_04045 [Spirochaetes bacterium GWB1_27_13]OHD20619.1 MAG: hypothetical protein A2Y34_17525 [Spirochaetes bacterium GWC1_27_15]OHD41814.1 MAG: hypothetical protein A2086_01685 [Spirochaetes bacterium GWD1_27_9]
MQKNMFLLFTLFLLITFFGCSQRTSFSNLQQRGNLFYKINSNSPFSGIAFEGKSTIGFKNGRFHGKYQSYYDNGQLQLNCTYNNGLEDGKYTQYYENGQIQVDATFKKGEMEGKYTFYFDNGNKYLEAFYKDSKEDGDQFMYSLEGDLQLKLDFKQGISKGEIEYYQKGILVFKRYSTKNGITTETYYENKQLKEKNNFKDNSSWDKYVEGFERDNKYSENPETLIISLSSYLGIRYSYADAFDGWGIKEGEFVKYLDNGKLERKETYKDNKLNGIFEVYSNNGNLKEKTNYTDGKIDGDYISYYKDTTQIKKQATYKQGLLDGEWKLYYKNGNPRLKISFKDGDVEGECITYYDNGNISYKTEIYNQKCQNSEKYNENKEKESSLEYEENSYDFFSNFGYISHDNIEN